MSFLCFICSGTVNTETNEETREKYKDVIGINLSLESQLCYICCHILNKLSQFKSLCLRRSLEYPALLSKKWPLDLQKSDLKIDVLCPNECDQQHIHNSSNYLFHYNSNSNSNDADCNDAQYVKLEHDIFSNYYENDNKELYYINDNVTENLINNDYNDKEDAKINKQELTYNLNQYDNLNHDKISDNNNFDDDINTANDEIEDDNINTYEEPNDDNCNANTDIYEDINPDINNTEIDNDISKRAIKKNKGKPSDKGYKRIVLSLEQQKAELEANRKKKKYIEAEFKCYNCALDFLFKDTYQAHMMRHEESNGEYQCTTCTLRFATVASLRIHRACHAERHICRKCAACLKPRAKRRHACFKPIESQSVACHLCGNLLKDADGLQQHLKRVHASKASGRHYACSVCGESYTRQGALRTHMIKHINRKFHCDICSSTYSSPYTLNEHKKSHQSGGLSHYCNTCGAGYATRKSLLAHLRNTSNHQTTTFECPICSRVCPNQKSLTSHIQSVHSKSKAYACGVCPARYTNRKSLVRHVGSHNRKLEVKMVICHICGGYFKGNSKLNRHIRDVCKKAKDDQMSSYE